MPAAIVPGRPSGPCCGRARRADLQFPFALGPSRSGPAAPGRWASVRTGAARSGRGPQACKVLAVAEAMTGRAGWRLCKNWRRPGPDRKRRDRNGAIKGRVRPLTPAPGPPNRGRGRARHPVDPAAGPPADQAVNRAESQVGSQASHRHASAGGKPSGKKPGA